MSDRGQDRSRRFPGNDFPAPARGNWSPVRLYDMNASTLHEMFRKNLHFLALPPVNIDINIDFFLLPVCVCALYSFIEIHIHTLVVNNE